MVYVTIEHVRALRFCTPGIKAFCKKYNLSLRDLITGDGLPEDKLRATGEAMALKAIEYAQNQQRSGD